MNGAEWDGRGVREQDINAVVIQAARDYANDFSETHGELLLAARRRTFAFQTFLSNYVITRAPLFPISRMPLVCHIPLFQRKTRRESCKFAGTALDAHDRLLAKQFAIHAASVRRMNPYTGWFASLKVFQEFRWIVSLRVDNYLYN